MEKMKVQEAVNHVNSMMKRVGSLLSKEESNALYNLIGLVQHEFHPNDDTRALIDDHICSIRWTKGAIEDICGENDIDITPDDIVSMISQRNFVKYLRECCELAGTEYIVEKAEEF